MEEIIDKKFKKIKSLGAGGQGEVFSVKKLKNGQIYALKLLKKINKNASIRFQDEILSLKKLNHPNIIKITEYNLSHNPPYYVMEIAKHKTLKDNNYFQNDIKTCLYIFKKICNGVNKIHSENLLHRDLKPSNILLVKNQKDFKISDFGLSYDLDKNKNEITKIREKVGAQFYAAPEQTDCPPNPTVKSDIFSLGKILYFMITGKTSRNLQEKIIIENHDKDPLSIKTQILINKMCEYHPKERIDSISIILKEIDKILNIKKSKNIKFSEMDFRILKFIESYNNSVNFKEIIEYIKDFYEVIENRTPFDLVINGTFRNSKKIQHDDFIKNIEQSLQFLERKKYLKFQNGEYKHLRSKIT